MRHARFIFLLAILAGLPARAAVFQYTVPVKTSAKPATAFLWLPPGAERVRGVVLGGMTLMERELARDTRIREACASEQLAIVFLTCGLGSADVQAVLDDLARTSGYAELSAAPLFFVGHSAGGPQAKALAIRMADRCFGLVLYRGGVPGGKESVPPGVPVLMMIGQFDEFGGTMRDESGREGWEGGRDALRAFRAADPRNLASIVVEPGAGHFAWSDRNAAYLALFIRRAAGARIPDWPADARQPVTCRSLRPESGWLSDLAIKAATGPKPAPYIDYAGEKSTAAWHFDRELAEATVAYHADGFDKLDQFIRWNDPYWVDAGARYFFTSLKWVGDGQTFEVHPIYAKKVPTTQPNGTGPRWAEAGQKVGHSAAPILVRPVSGPVVATGPDTLRIQFDALAPATDGGRVTFLACSVGDEKYRYTEQVGMMPRGFSGLKAGKPQVITFPSIDQLRPGSGPIMLKATSDSGLPVEYYVAYGPATVKDGRLMISETPVRAKFPIEVKVVAWQFGRGIEPLVQTARPIEQVIQIEKP